jgi:hypothetical protein
MHIAKKEAAKKEEPHYNVSVFAATTQTPPTQHLKFMFFKSDASKKETLQKHRRHPIKKSYCFLP